MLIDNKGRLFGLVSVIDIFVIAVILIIIIFGALQLGGGSGIGILQSPVPVSMSFTIENLETFTTNSINIGDPVADNLTGVSFGNITSINTNPTIEYNPNSDGILIASFLPDHYHLVISTLIEGFRVQNGVWISGHTFLIGEQIVIRAGNTNIFMLISDIYFM